MDGAPRVVACPSTYPHSVIRAQDSKGRAQVPKGTRGTRCMGSFRNFSALQAFEGLSDPLRPSLRRHYPLPRLPRRIVPHMTGMAAFQIGDPMPLVILMKPDNRP